LSRRQTRRSTVERKAEKAEEEGGEWVEENKCGEEEDRNSIHLRTVHRKKALTCSTIIQPHERANDPTKPQIKTTYELFRYPQ
jgi:hypothetical protein